MVESKNASALPALLAERNISPEIWSAMTNSLFPGAAQASVLMAWDYCAARGLDVMLKPVHLVPMYIKDKNNGDKGEMRDVVMPGIGLYRIQADRAGNYAGMSAPQFGPDVVLTLDGVQITVPEWCEMTVSKITGDRIVTFTAREYWIENYATAGRETTKPNAMWQKRPRGQLVKCTEAQALRKGWPELGAQPTAEEMEGKEIDITLRSSRLDKSRTSDDLSGSDGSSEDKKTISSSQVEQIREAMKFANISDEDFCKNFRVASVESLQRERFELALNKINRYVDSLIEHQGDAT